MQDSQSDNIQFTRQESYVDFVELSKNERQLIVDTLTVMLAYAQRRGAIGDTPLQYTLAPLASDGGRTVAIHVGGNQISIVEQQLGDTPVSREFKVELNTKDIALSSEERAIPLLDNESSYDELVELSRIVFDCESYERRNK